MKHKKVDVFIISRMLGVDVAYQRRGCLHIKSQWPEKESDETDYTTIQTYAHPSKPAKRTTQLAVTKSRMNNDVLPFCRKHLHHHCGSYERSILQVKVVLGGHPFLEINRNK